MTKEEKIKEIKLLQKQFDKHLKSLSKINNLKPSNKTSVIINRGYKMYNHITQLRIIYAQMNIVASQRNEYGIASIPETDNKVK
jgi:hypothetical protein